MSYEYEKEKSALFTDAGQRSFIKVRDKAFEFLKIAGAFSSNKIIGIGDPWFYLACLDRMVELGDIVEITGSNRRGQDRVFVLATH